MSLQPWVGSSGSYPSTIQRRSNQLEHELLSESQYSFYKERGTVDMVFGAR